MPRVLALLDAAEQVDARAAVALDQVEAATRDTSTGALECVEHGVLPVMDLLRSVVTDLRDLLDVSCELNEMLGRSPGLGRSSRTSTAGPRGRGVRRRRLTTTRGLDINRYAYQYLRMVEATDGSPADRYQAVGELFAAMASPVRAAAVHRLTERGWSVTELADELGVSQPLMSQHLRVLRAARVVSAHRTGRTTTYTLVDEHVAHVFLDAFTHTEESHP